MRQTAPLSPAIHLGAQRLLIIGAGRMHEPPGRVAPAADYPSLAQIAGHALSSIFLDALAVDVERLQRINRTLALLPRRGAARTRRCKPIEALVIAPSQRLDDIAARHVGAPAGGRCAPCCAAWASAARAAERAARRWPATCCSRRRTRAS